MKLGLVGHNTQEIAILQQVFTQKGFTVSTVKAVSESYLDLVKIEPEVLLMEVPVNYAEELSLLKRMQNNKKFHHCHIFTFGTERPQMVSSRLSPYGVVAHIQRPLKIHQVFETMLDHIGEVADKYLKEDIPLTNPIQVEDATTGLSNESLSGV
ncbi:MAG: hypothetical protein OCC49_00735 [Fibrobacterales bacterium]